MLKECCGFILSRHIVVKIHCNTAVDFNIKKDTANCHYLVENVFLHVKRKQSTVLVERADEEKFLDGVGNGRLKSLAC